MRRRAEEQQLGRRPGATPAGRPRWPRQAAARSGTPALLRSRPAGAASSPAAGARRRGRADRARRTPDGGPTHRPAAAPCRGRKPGDRARRAGKQPRRPSRGAIAPRRPLSRGHWSRHLRNVSPRGPQVGCLPKGLLMKKVGSFIGDWWRLVVPYFKSEERWIAIPLLIGADLADLRAPSASKCCSTTGTGASTTACRTRTRPLSGGRSTSSAARGRLHRGLCRARHRQPLSAPALAALADAPLSRPLAGRARLLPHRAAAHGRQRRPAHRRGPSAARRIHHVSPAGPARRRSTTLISFLFILWSLSGPLSLAPIGLDITIPGYMAWVCLIYAVVGTFLANLVGRRLIPLNFQKQRYEANFRFALVRVRENAEGIALYRGEEREAEALNARFADVFANGWRVLFTQAQLALYQSAYSQLAIIFPFLVTAPGFFAGTITLGVDDADGIGLRPGADGPVVLHRQLHLRRRAARRDGPAAGPAGGHRTRRPDTAIEVVPEAGRGPTSARSDLTLGLPNGQALLSDCDLRPAARPLDPDHGRQRLGQEHAVPRAGRHLAVRQGAGARAGRRARAVPAAEALHPDRHAARRGEVSRRAVDGDGCRDRGGAGGREARPSRGPPRRGRALDQHAVGRRAAARWPRRARWCSSPTGCSSTRPRPRSTRRWKPRSTRP